MAQIHGTGERGREDPDLPASGYPKVTSTGMGYCTLVPSGIPIHTSGKSMPSWEGALMRKVNLRD